MNARGLTLNLLLLNIGFIVVAAAFGVIRVKQIGDLQISYDDA